MGRRLNLVLLATFAIVASLQSSLAQSDYIVGDALGWVIPPGSSAYTTWAANKTFRIGDTLVFNFANGAHDVAQVTRANYDSCNGQNPILTIANSPANVTLNETGSHYFICAFPGHCAAGQKLAINVSAAASNPSPAPQPSTPAPQPTPVPSAPAPQVGSPTPSPLSGGPTRSPSPSPSSSSPSPSPSPSAATPPTSSSPSPSMATPPPSSDSPPSPTNPSTPSPASNATPPTAGDNSATSVGVAGLSVTFLSFVVALFL